MKGSFKFFSKETYAGILVVLLFLVSNNRSLVCWLNESCRYANFPADYAVWGSIALIALLLMMRFGKGHEYWQAWKRNLPLGLFILYSITSISWSILPERSLHTIIIMVAASVTAGVLAVIYPPKTLMNILLVFTAVCAVLSLLVVIVFPEHGIHQDAVWQGAWRGIFEHKNDFGPIMALGNELALLSYLSASKRNERITHASIYLLTMFLIIMSRCSTAVVMLPILNGLTFLYYSWMKWGSKLQGRSVTRVFLVLAAGALSVALLVIAVFLLTGKNLQLTGRVPLWLNLLENVVSKKPWFGYGLETVWYDSEFQKWAAVTSGWGDRIIVINGHNGYMDILIYLGIVGLILLCVFLVQGLMRATRRALGSSTWLDFFPLVTLVYFLVVNLTIDFMLEFESFHWIVMVILLFLPPGRFAETEQPSSVKT
ncbi:MAG TPA: O-antigen ligase family protein [Anaerolineales bacterium]|nr:O-antigen ligase family protein [Anaerolineales bacterium]